MSGEPLDLKGLPPVADSKALSMGVVVYLDILGYQEIMRACTSRDASNEQLRKLKKAMDDASRWIRDKSADGDLPSAWTTKLFTDNIVIVSPVVDPGTLAEPELDSLLWFVALFQLDMIRHGYFVRGAVAIGDVYVDGNLVFGPAILEAYEAEQNLVRDPRIVLASSAKVAVERHLEWHLNPGAAPQNRGLLRDADGQFFVDYLEDTILMAEEEAGPLTKVLMEHKSRVEERLQTHQAVPRIWSKYEWVARYHNFFCHRYPQHFDAEHLVAAELLSRSPSRLADAAGPG